jgi:hypothetical protein
LQGKSEFNFLCKLHTLQRSDFWYTVILTNNIGTNLISNRQALFLNVVSIYTSVSSSMKIYYSLCQSYLYIHASSTNMPYKLLLHILHFIQESKAAGVVLTYLQIKHVISHAVTNTESWLHSIQNFICNTK